MERPKNHGLFYDMKNHGCFIIRNFQFIIPIYRVNITSVATAVAKEANVDAIEIHFIVLSVLCSGFIGTMISDPGVIPGNFRKIKPCVEAVVPLG